MATIQDQAKGHQSTHSHSFGQLGYIFAQFFCSFYHATGYNDKNNEKLKF